MVIENVTVVCRRHRDVPTVYRGDTVSCQSSKCDSRVPTCRGRTHNSCDCPHSSRGLHGRYGPDSLSVVLLYLLRSLSTLLRVGDGTLRANCGDPTSLYKQLLNSSLLTNVQSRPPSLPPFNTKRITRRKERERGSNHIGSFVFNYFSSTNPDRIRERRQSRGLRNVGQDPRCYRTLVLWIK